jgi:hypothetical protein
MSTVEDAVGAPLSTQQRRRPVRVTELDGLLSQPGDPLEPVRVDLLGTQPQAITGPLGDQRVGGACRIQALTLLRAAEVESQSVGGGLKRTEDAEPQSGCHQ